MSKILRIPGKPIIAWLLAAVMLTAAMPTMTVLAFSEPVPDTDWYYNNTGAANFTLTTADQLAGMASLVNTEVDNFAGKIISLGNDIDLSAYGSSYNNGLGWESIGVDGSSFNGTFNGAGHVISNLYINNELNNGGLFGKTTDASVLNLGLENISIVSVNYTGALVGMSIRSTIEHCYATGSVSGGTITGGLIGYAQDNDVVSSCYFSGMVEGDSYVGGLIGNAGNDVEVTNCYTTGSVQGASRYVGGLIGWLYMYESYESGPTVKNCFSTSSVSGDDGVGGIAGSLTDSINGGIANCVALNALVSGSNNVNRIAGSRSENVYLCYNIALSSMSSGSGIAFGGDNTHYGLDGADISMEEALSHEFWSTTTPSWIAWDADVWQIADGALPTLKANYIPAQVPDDFTLIAGTAEGEPGDEVEIIVSLQNNHGIAGFNLSLSYDQSIITPISVTKNVALGGSVFASNVNEIEDKSTLDGIITAVWASSYDTDVEELFTVQFQINDISMEAGETIVTPINVYVDELKYLDRQDVSAYRQDGSVTVSLESPGNGNGENGGDTGDGEDGGNGGDTDLWGDANVDDTVDVYDLIRFAKHLAAIPSEELTVRGSYLSDVDRNDSVDLGDLILIARYLQSEDLDSPDVVLGIPQ